MGAFFFSRILFFIYFLIIFLCAQHRPSPLLAARDPPTSYLAATQLRPIVAMVVPRAIALFLWGRLNDDDCAARACVPHHMQRRQHTPRHRPRSRPVRVVFSEAAAA